MKNSLLKIFPISLAAALFVAGCESDSGHDQGVDEAGQDSEDDDCERCANDASNHLNPTTVRSMSMSLIPMNGAMMPPTP